MKHSVFSVFLTHIAMYALVLHAILRVFFIGIVMTSSMAPTLPVGNIYIATRSTDGVGKGDVVVFLREHTTLVKRIVAVGGDTVSFQGGYVFVNGVMDHCAAAAGMTKPASDDNAIFHVPDGCFFVLGDNREHSFDSRFWEHPFIDADCIIAVIPV